MNNSKVNILLDKARAWCSKREMCKSEIKTRLLRTDLNDNEISEIISVLVEERFVDESRFAKAFVHDKIAYQKWGINKIKQALNFKGISPDNINEALENVDKEEYLDKFLAVAIARKRSIKGATDYEKNQKLIRFLLSKGINTDDIFHILKKMNEEK